MRKIKIILALVMVLTFLSACQTDQGKAYMERIGMESDQFTSFVIVLDYGCHTYKDRFYEYVLEAFPEHSAVIFKRHPDQATVLPLVAERSPCSTLPGLWYFRWVSNPWVATHGYYCSGPSGLG